jgi:hypothetical protein
VFLYILRNFHDNGTSKPHAIDQPLEEGRQSRVRSLEFLYCARHCNAAEARTITRMQQQMVSKARCSTRTQTHTSTCKRGMGACILHKKRHANPNRLRYNANVLCAGYCSEGFLLRATRTPTSTRYFPFGGRFYMFIPTGSWVLVII